MRPDDLTNLAGGSLPAYLQQVEQTLLAASPKAGSLRQPSIDLIKGGGKRLRPTLVWAAYAAGGKKTSKTLAAAGAAVEMAHLASLVHDDIIDRASLRHGRPSIIANDSADTALLVGDFFLAGASRRIAGIGSIAGELPAAIGVMCQGQSLELADQYNLNRSIKAYLTASAQKTGALFCVACKMGALCADLPAGQVEALSRYGELFGTAYQLLDDLLDFLATPEEVGKPTGQDINRGIYTLPVLLSLRGPSAGLLKSRLKRPANKPLPRLQTAQLLLSDGSIEKSLDKIDALNRQAINHLGGLPQGAAVDFLRRLPEFCLSAGLKHQHLLSV